MTLGAIRRSTTLVLLIVAVGVGNVGQVQADVSATVYNATNTFSSTALYEPSGLAGAPAGRTVPLTWTAAPGGGNGNGYVISGVNIGGNAATACPSTAAGYTTFVAGSAGTSFTDVVLAAGTDGTYVCYLGQTGYDPTLGPPWVSAPVWTSLPVSPVLKTVIGFLPMSVAMTNGTGVVNTLDAGDTIVITFDQPVNTTTFPGVANLCTKLSTSTIYLGSAVTCGVLPTSTVGTLTGMTLSNALMLDGIYNATAAWSGGNTTLIITVGSLTVGTGASAVAAGTATFTAAAAITSATGAVPICTTALCKPTTTTRP